METVEHSGKTAILIALDNEPIGIGIVAVTDGVGRGTIMSRDQL
ncbi:MAG: hypothetical protein ACT6FE_06775 [Methanosarcinaceae archaeon]